ncbi:hypothetical protein GRF59_15130 [Paenibacillus sp. HJL G12]|uniref:Uncharacterized protein n=1 Tax=Paenibacillus dendrobii TaxID=2691084 RepID=A0A7X3IJ62_9BACL|nr:hypothetical protein [Paenibacillus dendrobii]MWV44954.1 hypothetical protein [Paenibacillus dendrobii]
MTKHFKEMQDMYYDGDKDYYDDRDVSPEMKQGTKDCIKYIEEVIDNEATWLKQEAQKKYYREPYKSDPEFVSALIK